jgi:predicted PurR-regulated permease PerM
VTAKQMAKMLGVIAISFGICFAFLFISDGSAAPVFDELLSAFLVIATLIVALSVAMFNYVESISKELSELRKEVPRQALNLVIEKLSSLKREVLYNGGLIATLFVMERVTKGIAIYLQSHSQHETMNYVLHISLSLRFSFFCVSLFAAAIQLKGFIVATEYRDVIAKNRK